MFFNENTRSKLADLGTGRQNLYGFLRVDISSNLRITLKNNAFLLTNTTPEQIRKQNDKNRCFEFHIIKIRYLEILAILRNSI